MATPVNPYKDLAHLEIMSVEDMVMKDAPSCASLESTASGSGAVDPPLGSEGMKGSGSNKEKEEEMVDFEDHDFTVPPSFSREISKETLHIDNQPFVFWATLKIPLPKKPW